MVLKGEEEISDFLGDLGGVSPRSLRLKISDL
jgi:hypothetical protein